MRRSATSPEQLPAKRERCWGEDSNGRRCRRRARAEGEYVTRMEAWVDRRLYCSEHAHEWDVVDD
jgi:hypothetical protein